MVFKISFLQAVWPFSHFADSKRFSAGSPFRYFQQFAVFNALISVDTINGENRTSDH